MMQGRHLPVLQRCQHPMCPAAAALQMQAALALPLAVITALAMQRCLQAAQTASSKPGCQLPCSPMEGRAQAAMACRMLALLLQQLLVHLRLQAAPPQQRRAIECTTSHSRHEARCSLRRAATDRSVCGTFAGRTHRFLQGLARGCGLSQLHLQLKGARCWWEAATTGCGALMLVQPWLSRCDHCDHSNSSSMVPPQLQLRLTHSHRHSSRQRKQRKQLGPDRRRLLVLRRRHSQQRRPLVAQRRLIWPQTGAGARAQGAAVDVARFRLCHRPALTAAGKVAHTAQSRRTAVGKVLRHGEALSAAQ